MTEQAIQAVAQLEKFRGMNFVFAGKFAWGFQDAMSSLIGCYGGRVVKEVAQDTTYVIVGRQSRGTPAEQKAAEKLNKSGATIQIIDESKMFDLCQMSKDELLHALKDPACANLVSYYFRLNWDSQSLPDLSGSDFRGGTFTALQMHAVKIDGADFSDATLTNVSLSRDVLKAVTFDKAVMTSCVIGQRARGCSFKGAKVLESRGNHRSHAEDCDFSGVTFQKVSNYSSTFTKCNFKGAMFDTCWFNHCQFDNCDMSDLSAAELFMQNATFKGGTMCGANLASANLTEAKFENVDMRNANLRGAVLIGADFSTAIIDGADFTGATVLTANFDQSQIAKAKGLKEALDDSLNTKAGPSVTEFENAVNDSHFVATSITCTTPEGVSYELHVQAYSQTQYPHAYVQASCFKKDESSTTVHVNGKSLPTTMIQLVARCKGASLDFESLVCRITQPKSLTSKEIKKIALSAWCELFGVEVPDEKALKEAKSAQKAKESKHRDLLMAELRGGMSGIKSWNARSIADKMKAGNFRKVDLSNQHLCDAQLDRLDFEGATFDGANLSYAVLDNCDLKKASFKNCNMEKTQIAVAKAAEADFSQANMKGAVLRSCSFSKAIFHETNLFEADLTYAKLQGADLSTAWLKDVKMYKTEFDEHTKLPPDFKPGGMQWMGPGPDPLQLKEVLESAPKEALNFDEFLERLQKSIDIDRLKKSLKMLKAESFQLFAEVTDEAMVGVVKSQTDPDLVYSARLSSNGVFACCTQNLNPCGGLRGALCKHLLVLIIGLTKAGQLDANVADAWARASKLQGPKLDKDIMSETFLRYKGAEAGEIDWRPTETIPEDYYAF